MNTQGAITDSEIGQPVEITFFEILEDFLPGELTFAVTASLVAPVLHTVDSEMPKSTAHISEGNLPPEPNQIHPDNPQDHQHQ